MNKELSIQKIIIMVVAIGLTALLVKYLSNVYFHKYRYHHCLNEKNIISGDEYAPRNKLECLEIIN